MQLSEFKKVGRENTGKASDLTRQLCLAGIAIIWLFKNPSDNSHLLNPILKYSLFILSLALLIDLLHYVTAGYIWLRFFRKEEAKLDDKTKDPDLKSPKWKSNLIYFFYYTKIILMLASYILICIYVLEKL